jgi:hypothetical protein
MIVMSSGVNLLGDSLHVIFMGNLGYSNSLDWMNDAGFDQSDGKRLDCGGHGRNRVVLRSERSTGERKDRGDLLVDTMTERFTPRLEPLRDREWPHY